MDILPKISIGLPVYNGEKYIQNAIESLLDQTFMNFELIISDNHSTDNTELICLKFLEKDKRIRYIKQSYNIGPVANFRAVLEEAKSSYFMWAACDDLWERNCLERYFSILEENKQIGVVIGKYWVTSIYLPFLAMTKLPSLSFMQHPTATERVRLFLEIPNISHKANIIYGLWRKEIIKKFFIRSCEFQDSVYEGLDMAMLSRVLADTQGYQIDEILFYKRYKYIPQGHFFSYIDKQLINAIFKIKHKEKKATTPKLNYNYLQLIELMNEDLINTSIYSVIENYIRNIKNKKRLSKAMLNIFNSFKFGLFNTIYRKHYEQKKL
jgi:glycosyltransferase involved in cell wall biosynthesis